MTVPRDAWPRVKEMFEDARALAPDARAAYLAAACDGDEALRREVETLLASHARAGSFLETPAVAFDESLPTRNLEGQRIGVHQIAARIGSGGMGEVYRARDTTLNRDVAIKVLLPAVATHPDRLSRFSREAQLLAALNHPHIAQIHGLETIGGLHALIMELVEGPTLADRIAHAAIPVDEALALAKQIAEALESAHEQGIVHRDLKPANIKIREDGTVKVLDFGLAKALDAADAAGVEAMRSPAPSALTTDANTLLGTAAYMSPEQARGRVADKRADIWAFGVVVFEMVAGRRPFTGDTISETLASVLRTDPDWQLLPADAPSGLRRLLRSCLDKDPRRRLQAIGDARVQIEDLLGGAPEDPIASRPAAARRGILTAAVVGFGGAIVVTALSTWLLMRPPPATLQPMRFAIIPPATEPLAIGEGHRDLVVSPDGTHVVYVGGAPGERRLMVRAIDRLDAVALAGSTDASSPFFSPDGQRIGFFSGGLGGEIKKVSLTGGQPESLARTDGNSAGASWSPDGTIVFATHPSRFGLRRVSASGGEVTVLTTPDAAQGERYHVFPSLLPGGRAVLFTIESLGPIAQSQVAVLDLTTGRRKTLIRGGSYAEYVEPGYLVFAAAGTLRAMRFDPVTLEVSGDSTPLVDSVLMQRNGAAEFSVSRQGALVYVPGNASNTDRSLIWVDRQGHEEAIAAPPRGYEMPRISPDGARVAVSIRDQADDIWIWDVARRTLSRLTEGPGRDWYPVWTPDGRRIVFASESTGGIAWQAADHTGKAERLTASPTRLQGPASISSDGNLVVMENRPNTGWDLRLLRLDHGAGRSSTTEPLVQTTAVELFGELSPDGHWLAYQSDESGRNQIWVRPFPNVDGGHWQVSTSGGITPAWARSGRELFYLDDRYAMTVVPVRTTPTFSVGPSTKLFEGRYVGSPFWRTYDVSADGRRFLMIKDNEQTSTPQHIVVVLNWLEELKRRVQ